MASPSTLALQTGWVHPRTRPALPPGYNWDALIKRHCPRYLLARLKTGTPRPEHGYVSAHRGLYDRALAIMENSKDSIENGVRQGLMHFELDGRIFFRSMLGVHDEVMDRITTQTGHWGQHTVAEILNQPLVLRDLIPATEKYDRVNYRRLDTTVPLVDDILSEVDGRTGQLDMRKTDLASGIFWAVKHPLFLGQCLLKGYSYQFPTFDDIDAAAQALGAPPNWHTIVPYIFVFHSEPLLKSALEAAGVDPTGNIDYSVLRYDNVREIAERSIFSFARKENQRLFVPEIGFSYLGLGYNKETGKARNPYDGTEIIEPAVKAGALVDRVLIDIALQLRDERADIHLSSCTRLYDARTKMNNYVSNLETSELDPWPRGEKRIPFKLRTIPGGLYPPTDMCNADDPFREMAARAWIEYAGLDRRKLLDMTYLEWIASAGSEVEAAFKELNGPFLPNTFVAIPEQH